MSAISVGCDEIVGEGPQRAADVLRNHPEGLGDARRELADAQLPIEEHRRDVGAVEQVLDVVVELLQLGVLLLVLGVDRVELLVDRVQLLVRALQLLVRRRSAPRWSPAAPRSRPRAPGSRLEVLPGVGELVFQRVHLVLGQAVDRRVRLRLGERRRAGTSAKRRHQQRNAAPASLVGQRDQDVGQRAAAVAQRLGRPARSAGRPSQCPDTGRCRCRGARVQRAGDDRRSSSSSISSRFCDGRRALTLSSDSTPPKVSTSCPCSSTRKPGGMKRSSSRS